MKNCRCSLGHFGFLLLSLSTVSGPIPGVSGWDIIAPHTIGRSSFWTVGGNLTLKYPNSFLFAHKDKRTCFFCLFFFLRHALLFPGTWRLMGNLKSFKSRMKETITFQSYPRSLLLDKSSVRILSDVKPACGEKTARWPVVQPKADP